MSTAAEICEEHQVLLTWMEDGNAESGPSEPYLSCHVCKEEHEHPMIYCEDCGKHVKTASTSLVMPDFDPTTAYRLECGHVVI